MLECWKITFFTVLLKFESKSRNLLMGKQGKQTKSLSTQKWLYQDFVKNDFELITKYFEILKMACFTFLHISECQSQIKFPEMCENVFENCLSPRFIFLENYFENTVRSKTSAFFSI